MSSLSAADNVVALYQSKAEAWNRSRDCSLFEKPWLDHFLAACGAERRSILDLGCGTGQPIAEYLIRHNRQITGVDAASNMIAIAQKRFLRHTWINADMRALPYLPKFQGIIAWHSFFHLTPHDQKPMFETFKALIEPGGALMFTTGVEHGETIGTFDDAPLYHSSLDTHAYRELLHLNGFDVIKHIEMDDTCGGATVWLARNVRDLE